MTQTLDVQATKTTVTVDGEPFHVYEYHNDQYIDIVIRTDRGNRIELITGILSLKQLE